MISGAVTDQKDTALANATVVLSTVGDTLAGDRLALTDHKGRFMFKKMGEGRFLVTVSAVGFQTMKSDTINISQCKPTVTVDLKLVKHRQELDNVTVKAGRLPVAIRDGKMIFNVQNATNAAGQTALDVLSKLPGISLDQNENISLRGMQGINVMVDGRMTYLSGPSLVNFLKGLNAQDLAVIELLNSPGSDFDANGNAGIINIVTKRKSGQGFSWNLRSAVSKGRYVMNNQNITLAYRSRRLNVYGSFDYNTPHRYVENNGSQTVPGISGYPIQRTAYSGYKIHYYTWRAGADWEMSRKHKVGFNYHGYLDDFSCFHVTQIYSNYKTGQWAERIQSRNDIVEPYHYGAWNISYQYLMDSAGKKITADADFTSYKNYSDAFMQSVNYGVGGNMLTESKLRSSQPGFVLIQSVKTDIDLPYSHWKMRAGLKFSNVSNDNHYQFDSVAGDITRAAGDISDHFKYNERIAAVYLSANKSFAQTHVSAGMRLEHTRADGNTLKKGTVNSFGYLNLFPSLTLEQQLPNAHLISLSVSRRINRPSYTSLNPVRWYRDPYFYFSGNPLLLPELAWVLTTSYQYQKKYNLSLAYNTSRQFIAERLSLDEEGRAIRSQSANFGTMKRLDATIAAPFSITTYWKVYLTCTGGYMRYPLLFSNREHELEKWSLSASIQQDITLPWGIAGTLNSYYFSSQLQGVFVTGAYYQVDGGIKKAFFSNRLSIQFSVSDIFNSRRMTVWSAADVGNYFNQSKPDTRRAGISLSWNIGSKMADKNPGKTEEQLRL